MNKIRKLHLKHVSERLKSLKENDLVSSPPGGWIQFIKDALSMSTKALAKRAGVSPSTMSETIKAERENGITLKRLQKVADAMDCDLVYYFLPRNSIDQMIEERAHYLAEEKLRNIAIHMSIEDQSLTEEFIKDRIEDEVQDLRYSKKLWD